MERHTVKEVNNPREGASAFSIATFRWIFTTFFLGYKRDLEITDIHSVLKQDKSSHLGEVACKIWESEEEKLAKSSKKRPKLLSILWRLFKVRLIVLGIILAVLELSFHSLIPMGLFKILKYFKEEGEDARLKTLYWSFALTVILLTDGFLNSGVNQALNHLELKMRVVCNALIYRKVLKVSTKNTTNTGQIVNMITNDTRNFENSLHGLHYIWIGTIKATGILILLCMNIKSAAAYGLALIFAFVPLFVFKIIWVTRLAKLRMYRADDRLHLTDQILNQIKLIKIFAWENLFARQEDKLRKKELRALKKEYLVSRMFSSLSSYIPRISLLITVIGFIILGERLVSNKVYLVGYFYGVVGGALFTTLPYSIHRITTLKVSINRIQRFLDFDEYEPTPIARPTEKISDTLITKAALTFLNYSAKWSMSFEDSALTNITLDIERGSFVVLIGQVGSGKSSLLQAILNEVPIRTGQVKVNGKISYASQEPWIFPSSLRQNILFGQPMDEERYQEVIKVCQLQNDFKQFPYGDQTLVGERGMTLSGGQCARINLARAIYFEADIYLLDDPLSSIDSTVAKKIFTDCFGDFLKEKTVVLATHQIQSPYYVDKIILLSNGKVKAQGTFDEIKSNGDLDDKLRKIYQQKTDVPRKSLGNISFSQEVVHPTETVADLVDVNVEEAEESKTMGTVKLKTFLSYFKAANSCALLTMVFLTSIALQLSNFSVSYFLAYWLSQEESNSTVESQETSESSVASRSFYIYTYGAIILLVIFTSTFEAWFFTITTIRISRNLHSNMFNSIVNTSMTFFNETPVGRIINRYAKDFNIVDTILIANIRDVKHSILAATAAFCGVIATNVWFLVPALVNLAGTFILRQYCVRTCRSVKRLEGITKSPVLKHVTNTVRGLITIRAVKGQKLLSGEFDNHQDLHTSAWFIWLSATRAFTMYMDFLTAIFISVVIFAMYFLRGTVPTAFAGYAISQSLTLARTISHTIKRTMDLENEIISVERILEYSELPAEPGHSPKQLVDLPKVWPENGQIEFNKVSLNYGKEDKAKPSLKELSFLVKPKEKIGIVGRTGAGKSSIINVLFRLNEFDGQVLIDNVPIDKVTVSKLRPSIGIIPQDPMLFSGSLRYNLDPFDEYSNGKLWSVLDEVKIRAVVSDSFGLSTNIIHGGENLSSGQRQIICLARAVMRNYKIIVIDEATAKVDLTTENFIHKIIREKFVDATVLIISHRLDTVMDCDRIFVMNEGQLVEEGIPSDLMSNKSGLFYSMVQKAVL